MDDLTLVMLAEGLPSEMAAMDARETYQSTAGGMLDAILAAYCTDAPTIFRAMLKRRLNAGVMDALTDLHTGATGYDVCEANREAVLNLLAPEQ